MKIFHNLCRTCLVEPKNALPLNCLVSMEETTETLQSMYELFTHLKIKPDENLPQQMCKECVNKLNLAYRFLKQCLESDEFLKNGTIEFVEVDDEEDRLKLIEDMEQGNEDGIVEEELEDDNCDNKSNESFSNIAIEELNLDNVEDSNEDIKYSKISSFEESFENSITNMKTEILEIEKNNEESDDFSIEIELENHEETEEDEERQGLSNLKPRRKRNMGEPQLCTLCGRSFKTIKKYKSHLEEHEIQKKLKDSGQDPDNIKCESCDRNFTKVDAYIRHQKIHNPSNPNICEICGKAFISPSLLKVHRARHTGIKPHVCKLCNKGFTTKFDLEVHLRFHTGERPYKCKFCEKAYVSQSHRSEHMRSKHIDVDNAVAYDCDVCGQNFKTRRTLQTHMKRHKDLQIKCRLCDKTFPNSKLVLTHLRTHPEYEPLSCEFCGKTFREEHHLESHTKLHII